jgi:5-methylcytosine-specific restriction endonuclease McrA
MSVLNQNVVLILNRAWQAIHVRTPQEVFPMLATNVATALDIEDEKIIIPVTWSEWLLLPVREQDRSVMTIRGPVRIPTVIVLANYAKVPKKRPRLCSSGIRERDGNRCQYSGKQLTAAESSLDHVVPRSRGGKNSWENIVLADKTINAAKANRTPAEAGLKLLKKPTMPLEVPVTNTLRNSHNIPEWNHFLHQ